MKLIVTYSTSDGCTYHADHVVPVEYDSEEAFLVDFEKWAEEHRDGNFLYANEGFLNHGLFPSVYFGDEFSSPCEVYTLEKWFENNCNKT